MSLEILTDMEMNYKTICIEQRLIYSEYLERAVITDAYIPKGKFLVSGGIAHFNFKLPAQVTYLASVNDLEALM